MLNTFLVVMLMSTTICRAGSMLRTGATPHSGVCAEDTPLSDALMIGHE